MIEGSADGCQVISHKTKIAAESFSIRCFLEGDRPESESYTRIGHCDGNMKLREGRAGFSKMMLMQNPSADQTDTY